MSTQQPEPGAAAIEPQVHERDMEIVEPAGRDLYGFMREWRKRHPLTDNEVQFVLARVTMEFVTHATMRERQPK